MSERVTLTIDERSPFAGGRAFGDAGPYERLRGRARIAVDPDHPGNTVITDLDKAPREEDGTVVCTADFVLLKPVDPARGNRRLFYDYGNRGNMRSLQFFNDAPGSNDPRTAAHAGNGYLFRRGYTVLWSAWQGDLVPGNDRVMLEVPVATDGDAPITGTVAQEFIVDEPGVTTLPLSARSSTRPYPTVSRDTTQARLTRRRYATSLREEIPATDWAFARLEGGEGQDDQGHEIGIHPSDEHIHIPAGFEPDWIYELVYTARDPLVLGLGHAAVRDLVGHLRFAAQDLVGPIDRAYCWGRSQTGRCIRDFIYRGFNADTEGRKVFDGALPHVAGAGLMWMNHRFANAVSSAGNDHKEFYIYGDRFPFSYAETTDHLTSRTDAILKRPETDPLVIHTQTATEYWIRRGSLVHTDTRGNDLPQPEGVRVYLWSGSQHFASPLISAPPKPANGRNDLNTVYTSPFFRAMLDALDAWATDGTEPPPSAVPLRADGTLVDMDTWREQFPAIPGQQLPAGPAGLPLIDHGPDADDGILTTVPGRVSDPQGYPILLPSVDADGNEVPGVRAPSVAAPLATHTGWNLRATGSARGITLGLPGSTIPFPETDETAAALGDPRASILSRYPTPDAYVDAVRAAAEALVAAGHMLEEDIARCVAQAADWGRVRHRVFL